MLSSFAEDVEVHVCVSPIRSVLIQQWCRVAQSSNKISETPLAAFLKYSDIFITLKQHCEQYAALLEKSGPNLTRENLLLVWCFLMDVKDVAMSPFHLSPQTDWKFYRCLNGSASLAGWCLKERQLPICAVKLPFPQSHSTCTLKILTAWSMAGRRPLSIEN